jgi:cobalt transporter subunit CbtA
MSVFRSIVFSAVVTGFVVGAAVTVAQLFSTVPLIIKSELYERGTAAAVAKPGPAHEHSGHQHAEHEHGSAAWEPKDGLQRNFLAGIYALRGYPVTWYEGLLWGLGGFLVFTAAPGLGLPPELPSVPTAPLEVRQIWWIATASATASGLGLFVFRQSAWAVVLGFCLIVLPHLIGAPRLAETHTDVPAALSHQFVVAVTLTSFLFWVLLGSLTSVAYRRFST